MGSLGVPCALELSLSAAGRQLPPPTLWPLFWSLQLSLSLSPRETSWSLSSLPQHGRQPARVSVLGSGGLCSQAALPCPPPHTLPDCSRGCPASHQTGGGGWQVRGGPSPLTAGAREANRTLAPSAAPPHSPRRQAEGMHRYSTRRRSPRPRAGGVGRPQPLAGAPDAGHTRLVAGGHLIRYINIRPLRCTPETSVILYPV